MSRFESSQPRRRRRSVLPPTFAGAALLLLAAGPSPAQDLKELARQARDSVVLLNVFAPGGRAVGTGTGFFVEGGRLVTNFHVIDRAARVEAVLANEESLEVTGVAAVDEANDLAILDIASGPFPGLALADSGAVEAGERIIVLGNPLGLSGTLSEGIVSAVRDDGLADEPAFGRPRAREGGSPLLQISAAISPGSSGSPVMNLSGEVVGVAVSQIVAGQNLNFAVPAAAVRALLDSADAGRLERRFGAGPGSGGGAYLRNVVISLLIFAALYVALRYWA